MKATDGERRRVAGGALAMIVVALPAWAALAAAQPPEDRSAPRDGAADVRPMMGERPGPDRGTRGRGPEARSLVSPEQTEQLMAFLKEHFPARYQLLSRLQERNPEAFERRIAEVAPRVLELLLRTREDPELGELLIEQQRLELDLKDMVRQYRTVTEDAESDRAELRERIEESVARMVDIRLQRREHEITELERRLQRQRDKLAEDRSRREDLAAERLEELLGDRGLDAPGRAFRGRRGDEESPGRPRDRWERRDRREHDERQPDQDAPDEGVDR